MLVLLPPSEGKSAPTSGGTLDLSRLGGRSLSAHRRRVLTALIRVSRSPDAAQVLGTGPSLAPEVLRNTRLRSEPVAAAREVYTGVLYAAAGLTDLPDDHARERAGRCILTVSALWGVVGPADPIPAYRLSMGTDLPGVGPLAASWRGPLAKLLDPLAADRLVVDCRSAPYVAAWTVPVVGPGRVAVKVVRDVGGRRSVVSHAAKHTRGLLTRHLLTRAADEPRTPQELLGAAHELVGSCLEGAELTPGPPGQHVLTLLVA